MSPGKTYAARMEVKEDNGYVFSCFSSINLSFAVWLVDDYTLKEPLGEVRMGLKEENKKALKNLSGYYTFSGLPKGKYTLRVESEFYFTEEKVVDTSTGKVVDTSTGIDLKDHVIEIKLRPKPSYPFSDRTTLIRGMLAADPVLLASITVEATSKIAEWKIQGVIQGIPDEKGEFVLYFREAIKGKADVDLEIRGESVGKIVPALVEEGRSTYTGLISIP